MFPFPLDATLVAVDPSGEPILYTVKVEAGAASTVITKRFSQFQDLRDRLVRVHSHVPALPSKMNIGDPRDRHFLAKRKEGLAAFLSSAFMHPTIPQSPDFVAFLVPAFPSLWQATLETYLQNAEASHADLAKELDDAKLEIKLVHQALTRKLQRASEARAVRSSFGMWRAQMPTKAESPEGSVAGSVATFRSYTTYRSNTFGPKDSELNRALNLMRGGSASSVLKRSSVPRTAPTQEHKQHQSIALQHSLGLANKTLKANKNSRPLSDANITMGDRAAAEKVQPFGSAVLN